MQGSRLAVAMPFIRVIRPEEATGDLKKQYELVAKTRGAVGNVWKATSLHPASIGAHLTLYQEVHFGEGPLSRRERELVATVVSRENACAYCVTHHADAFGRHAQEPGLQMLVATDYTKADLSSRERALADHAVKLTRTPGDIHADDVERLRRVGLDDRAVCDLTLLVAYFNFVNRIASGLGVALDDVRGAYQY